MTLFSAAKHTAIDLDDMRTSLPSQQFDRSEQTIAEHGSEPALRAISEDAHAPRWEKIFILLSEKQANKVIQWILYESGVTFLIDFPLSSCDLFSGLRLLFFSKLISHDTPSYPLSTPSI